MTSKTNDDWVCAACRGDGGRSFDNWFDVMIGLYLTWAGFTAPTSRGYANCRQCSWLSGQRLARTRGHQPDRG